MTFYSADSDLDHVQQNSVLVPGSGVQGLTLFIKCSHLWTMSEQSVVLEYNALNLHCVCV